MNMKIVFQDQYFKFLGRTAVFDDTLFLSLSGSGIGFEYTGCGFDVTFLSGNVSSTENNEGNYARMAVYIDDVRVQDFLLRSPETTVTIAACSTARTVQVRIVKLSECAQSLAGIRVFELAEGETIRPLPPAPHRIEFIGDSITCGYGVDDEDPLHPFQTATEDTTKSFAFKTAQALGADYSMFSTSGYGIISGYTGDPSVKMDHQLIPSFYESFGFSYDSLPGIPAPMDIPWDFSRYSADAVVINLGTNDDSYCQEDESKRNEYAEAYTEFLKTVRKHNPHAMIFCILGLMGDRLYPMVCEAAKKYRETTGDTRITTVHLPEQDGTVGYVSDYHPLESAHTIAAGVLTDAIRSTMGW